MHEETPTKTKRGRLHPVTGGQIAENESDLQKKRKRREPTAARNRGGEPPSSALSFAFLLDVAFLKNPGKNKTKTKRCRYGFFKDEFSFPPPFFLFFSIFIFFFNIF